MKHLPIALVLAAVCLTHCQNQPGTPASDMAKAPAFEVKPSLFHPEKFTAPRPEKKPRALLGAHGEQRSDDYYWLNERDNPAVRDYLEAENRYADSVLAPVAGLREKLFAELKARIQERDNSVPYFKHGYWYYTRFEEGREYGIFCRKKERLDAAEEILLDVNVLAQGHAFCEVGALEISSNNMLLAYSVDFTGRYLFRTYLKNLLTGAHYNESFESGGALAWANDNKTLFYDTKDPVTLRNDKIWRHTLGEDPQQDRLAYHEKDETLYAELSKSKSEQYIFISLAYTQTMEVRYLDANRPAEAFKVIRPREPDFYYYVEHWQDKFLIRTNWEARNFRLMETPVQAPARENWRDVLPHRPDVLLADFTPFQDYLVTLERKGGLDQLHILRWSDRRDHYLEVGEPCYDLSFGPNYAFDTKLLRYVFSSLKTPPTTVDYDMETRGKTVLKVQPVLGGFSAENYATEFRWATARDGVKVPVSIVYRKGLALDGSAPCYLFGYGSYGYSYDPGFDRNLVSLLDRGFVCAIAHVRGGMEMGFQWYDDGRMLHKMNTFNDFIDCSEMLVQEKYTSTDRLFASGRSAGGLLMGAVANMRPDLYRGIITGVPFVDVLTTMSDPSIPLTTGEYTEWGNPANAAEYAYMKQYSPYDNVRAQAYPELLVLTSFSDSQVQYFEPAKYVAKLRDLKTDNRPLLFRTLMSGSHGGSSGRFERLKERALEYAWMLGVLGGLN